MSRIEPKSKKMRVGSYDHKHHGWMGLFHIVFYLVLLALATYSALKSNGNY
jgi:hypothetical protein